jgi:thioredoxin-dependent peroxiredoxin
MTLSEGRKSPAFTLESDAGERVSLKDFAGTKWVVLYFYPKDDTPGCTTEACDFRDGLGSFDKLDAEIMGISPDPARSHARFKAKHGLNFMRCWPMRITRSARSTASGSRRACTVGSIWASSEQPS